MSAPAVATIESANPSTRSAPAAPRTLEGAGIPIDSVEQLLLKTLYTGESVGTDLAHRIGLPFVLIEPLIEHARAERLIEVRGASTTGSATFRYALTDAGRQRARQHFETNRYVGPLPVPLAQYVAEMRALAAAHDYIERERLQRAFSHLIIGSDVLEQLGPAVNGGKAVFLYGPAGNGKTVIADGMGRARGGDMHIPYAIDIEGEIVTMFDPVNHEALDTEPADDGLVRIQARDQRWLRIARPVVFVGGELTLDMLDLSFNPVTKFYEAPIQLKANGGVFLVDDFGRQRVRPDELLNRWIVPLENRVDYLTLHTGKKFEVPFDTLVVFATNLDPESLGDEAFLRRIPYKIPITDPDVEQFTKIFEMECTRRGLRWHPVMVSYVLRRYFAQQQRALRSCQPRDLLDHVVAMCRYRGIKPVITRELLDIACSSYFLEHSTQSSGAFLRPPAGSRPADTSKPAGVH